MVPGTMESGGFLEASSGPVGNGIVLGKEPSGYFLRKASEMVGVSTLVNSALVPVGWLGSHPAGDREESQCQWP